MATNHRSSAATLFELLRGQPRTTRTELVRASGLSKATVSESIAAFLSSGYIAEVGKRQPGRGRSQVVLEFQPAVRLVVGVQFMEDGCHVALADLRAGKVASTQRLRIGSSPEEFVDAACACVEELAGQATSPIIGLGVGVPGLVDPKGRVVIASVPYGWEQVPICAMLEERLQLPAIAANRAKAAALGEYWQGNHGATRQGNTLAYVHAGTGIVAGLVIDGRVFFGSGGAAGELGHTTVMPDGPVCGCGNQGCLHALASESALIRLVRTKSRQRAESFLDEDLPSLSAVTLASLVRAAERGDPIVLEAVTEVAGWLGIAIANLINLMNPSIVVIGGSMTSFGAPLMDALRSEIRRRALWDALHGVPIVASTLGDNASTLGAAALFLQQLDVSTLLGAA